MIAALTILSVSVFAQTEQNEKSHKTTIQATTFSCPMHPEIISDIAGKCSKCGMDLKKAQKTTYTCPMHPDEMSLEKGKCSKCGMAMVKTTKLIHNTAIKGSQTSSKVVTKYVCEMDGQIYDKPGKCPKCGMDLTKEKMTPEQMKMMKEETYIKPKE